jgi:hypothetical protein
VEASLQRIPTIDAVTPLQRGFEKSGALFHWGVYGSAEGCRETTTGAKGAVVAKGRMSIWKQNTIEMWLS